MTETEPKRTTWYAKATGGHIHNQALVIEEETGRDVAVAYDKADAITIAHHHNSHAALVEALEKVTKIMREGCTPAQAEAVEAEAHAALALAKEGT